MSKQQEQSNNSIEMLFNDDNVSCKAMNLQKSDIPVSTGIGFLDHMIDQFYSHAQIGISINIKGKEGDDDHNRNSDCYNQTKLLYKIGEYVGTAIAELLLKESSNNNSDNDNGRRISVFACPLDEALTKCIIQKSNNDGSSIGKLHLYTLAPYGKYPKSSGRKYIGKLETVAIRQFWEGLAMKSGLNISFEKIRGNNAHHIVESSFKAFSRALRNYIDGINCNENNNNDALEQMYGINSNNNKASLELNREGNITRKTKETSIVTTLKFDNGIYGIKINTGIKMLDIFFIEFAKSANISLHIHCIGDVWVDEHHTAEDVAIAIGQVLNTSLGTKAGLNRMWYSTCSIVNSSSINVTMDLSNRPCLIHNLHTVLEEQEYIDDLSCEMFEHVLESIVINSRMTVHIVNNEEKDVTTTTEKDVTTTKTNLQEDMVIATARAFGTTLKYCSMIDSRRAGTTASSKGTLSV